ncbi:uncharacterized protein LOC111697641 [Eurytemora carolleeae]|uniref:uncharacterized protein LOC111697641 n=1 Tax=Eurytemora carolleeae TaxID=1294199 RepID=UPI000C7750AF|nr:uncharacterized protein LOC111697641 [Eurytemora carolleeae]|eukprot:XP_023323481.1 uncharacterized protein LOC111697641 [Eurytemora affinis]
MEETEYMCIDLLRPVFYPVSSKMKVSTRDVLGLVKICSDKIVLDSSMCQSARFLLPQTLIETLFQTALEQGRDRAVHQLLRGWSGSNLVLSQLLPGLYNNQELFHSYTEKRQCVKRAHRTVTFLLSALQDFVPNSLVELDLTGFPSVSSASLSPDSSYAKTIKNLRCKEINVIEDQTHFDTKESTWKNTIVFLFDGKEEHPLNLGGGNSCLGQLNRQVIDLSRVSSLQIEVNVATVSTVNLIAVLGNCPLIRRLALIGFKQGGFRFYPRLRTNLSRLLKSLTKLRRLDLTNSLDQGLCELLCPELVKLEYLNISRCTLTPTDVLSLGNLNQLKHLDISGSSGQCTRELSSSLVSMTSLEILEIVDPTTLIQADTVNQTIRGCRGLQGLVVGESYWKELNLLNINLKWIISPRCTRPQDELIVEPEICDGYIVHQHMEYIKAVQI